ncbi:hypothetical protein ACTFIU_010283 [Dictyostelium citrinum]
MDYYFNREKRILNEINCKLVSYPFYLISSIEKTRNGASYSNTLQIINEIKNEKGIIGFYKGIGTLIVLSPIYFSTKFICNSLVSKLFTYIESNNKNKIDKEKENKIEIENKNKNENETISKLKSITSFIYQYPKMMIKDCLILSPFRYSGFKIIKDVLFRDNGDLNFKSTVMILIKLSPGLPIFILRRILNLIGIRKYTNNIFSGYSFSNLFYSSISVIPILILNQLIIIGLNEVNKKIYNLINDNQNKNNNNNNNNNNYNNNNNNSKLLSNLKNIYFNSITQGIIITILTNPLEVIRLQYIHQFIGSYVEKSLNSPSQQSTIGSGSDSFYNNILPIVIDPISMAIKISKEKGRLKLKTTIGVVNFIGFLFYVR